MRFQSALRPPSLPKIIAFFAVLTGCTGGSRPAWAMPSTQTAGTALVLRSSANPVLLTNPVTLQGAVASPVGIPTGLIAFYDGAQLLGSAMVDSSGVGALITSFATVGTHPLTASYSGGGSSAGEISAAVPEIVEDFDLGTPVMLDNNTCQCHLPAETSIYLLSLNPVGGATLPSAISLTVSGPPPGTTATLAPVSIAPGAGTTPVTLTIQKPAGVGLRKPGGSRRMFGVALSLMVLPLAFAGQRRRARMTLLNVKLLVWMLALAGAAAGVAGCGHSNATPTSPSSGATPYTLTITAVGGQLQHTALVTIPSI